MTRKTNMTSLSAVIITYNEENRENQPKISTGMFINNSLQNTLTFNITTQEYTLDNNDEEKK